MVPKRNNAASIEVTDFPQALNEGQESTD